ncbi:MAG TPA: hypothetical protein VMS65_10755, partial [Polyangiaceae bacterium]|nr:hypothetical protein [Polyangiaceae bacterium]
IAELVMRACDRKAELRFQSAREMADALERLDREHGWLASHAEVAALVEDILAPDLVYRRRRVARVVHGEKGFVSTEVQVDPPPAFPPVSEARRRVISHARALPDELEQASANDPEIPKPASVHRLRSMRSLTVGVLGVAAVAALALLVSPSVREPPSPKQAEPVEITAAPAPNRERNPGSDPAPQPALPSAQQSAAVPRPSAAPLRAERVQTPNTTATRSQPVHSSSLRKQNPYRRAPSTDELQAASAVSNAGGPPVRR